jgi:hypothetical protein
MLLTQTLRDTAPLRASLDAALTYIGTFAADADAAAACDSAQQPDTFGYRLTGRARGQGRPPPQPAPR